MDPRSNYRTTPNHTAKSREAGTKGWMTNEILDLMDKRRVNKNNKNQYEMINKEVMRKFNEIKEMWLDFKMQRDRNILH